MSNTEISENAMAVFNAKMAMPQYEAYRNDGYLVAMLMVDCISQTSQGAKLNEQIS